MGPLVHAGVTVALLAGADLAGYDDVNKEIATVVVVSGFLLDGDMVFEILINWRKAKLKELPDITARCRILHSIFVWPFGWLLSIVVDSWLPLWAVLLHAICDSAIPGLVKDGKNYPSHSPLIWIMFPFLKKWWYKIVPIGWPVTYPPELNFIYRKLAPIVGGILFIVSIVYFCE